MFSGNFCPCLRKAVAESGCVIAPEGCACRSGKMFCVLFQLSLRMVVAKYSDHLRSLRHILQKGQSPSWLPFRGRCGHGILQWSFATRIPSAHRHPGSRGLLPVPLSSACPGFSTGRVCCVSKVCDTVWYIVWAKCVTLCAQSVAHILYRLTIVFS